MLMYGKDNNVQQWYLKLTHINSKLNYIMEQGDYMAVLRHTSVMLPEVLGALNTVPGGRYIDATCSEGGHSQAILRAASPGSHVLGLDADNEGLLVAKNRLAEYEDSFVTRNANFAEIGKVAAELNFAPVHGILFDLGLSSLQLDATDRGFSFRYEAPLDMRFSVDQELTAEEVVNSYSEQDLANVLHQYGEEPAARRIASMIVSRRPLKTSFDLAEAVVAAVGKQGKRKIHPATRTFQAIRIAVNQELTNLSTALEQSIPLLGIGGRIVVISYHSLEDRIVKNILRRAAADCVCPDFLPECTCKHVPLVKLLGKGATLPSAQEVKSNPRSRSAKLRAAERI